MSFESISKITNKTADVYAFTEGERNSILLAAEQAGLSLTDIQGDVKVNYIKKLNYLKRKEVSLTLHASTLTEYLRVQRIPRGLRSTVHPVLLHDDKEYQSKWYALCNRHSLDLMCLTVQHLQIAIQETQKELSNIEKEFKEHEIADTVDKVHAELKTNIDKLRTSILQVKLSKFERDTKDYQYDRVYTWAEERRRTRRVNRETRGTFEPFDAASTDSEAGSTTGEQSKTSKVFLGARPKEVKQRKPQSVNIGEGTQTRAQGKQKKKAT